jgi:hypothetical protein
MHVQERDCFQMETQAYTMLRPIAAFSAGEASQYPYFAATSKSCCIVSGVGGSCRLIWSKQPGKFAEKRVQLRFGHQTPRPSRSHREFRVCQADRTVLGIIFLRSWPAHEEANSSLRPGMRRHYAEKASQREERSIGRIASPLVRNN